MWMTDKKLWANELSLFVSKYWTILVVWTHSTNISVEFLGFELGTSWYLSAYYRFATAVRTVFIDQSAPPTYSLHGLPLGLSASNEAVLRGKMAPLPLPQNQNVYFATVLTRRSLGTVCTNSFLLHPTAWLQVYFEGHFLLRSPGMWVRNRKQDFVYEYVLMIINVFHLCFRRVCIFSACLLKPLCASVCL